MKREKILESLLNASLDIKKIQSLLMGFNWDCNEDIATLTKKHIKSILNRFLKGDFTAEEVETWANLIECRDDIAIENNNDKIKEILFELSNPEIATKLTPESAKFFMQLLS